MKLRSVTTRLSIILATLCAFAFQGDDQAFYFSLSSDQIFLPGQQAVISLSGDAPSGAVVTFRAYRINDPVEFFSQQKDPHSIQFSPAFKPNAFEMIRSGFDKMRRDMNMSARDVMHGNVRKVLRDVTDLNAAKSSPTPPKPATTKKPKGKSRNRTAPVEPTVVEKNDLPAPKGAEKFEVVAKWDVKMSQTTNDYYRTINVPLKQKGVYVVEAQSRGRRALTVVIVSEYSMIFKQSATRALAYIVNRQTGEHVSDFPVSAIRNMETVTKQTSGSNGVAQFTIPPVPKDTSKHDGGEDENEDDWYWERLRNQVLVVGERDGNFVISEPYYYSYNSDDERHRTYIHTDRPIYRPMQPIYYRGITRIVNEDGTFKNMDAGKAIVKITDPRDGIVKRDTLNISDLGTFSGELTTGEDAPLGTYSLEVTVDGSTQYHNFDVEEYKKPEYKVEVTLDKQNYTRGDSLRATVKSAYFFGSPVTNAEVEYFVYRSEYWRPWWRGSEWEYLYEEGESDFYTYRSEMVRSGKGQLNSDGTFTVVYGTDAKADKDYVYRVQANVVDNSRNSITAAKSAEVTRGEFYIVSRTDKYVYTTNSDAKVSFTIATFDGDKPVGTALRAKLERRWWERVLKSASGTDSTYEYKSFTETVWTGTGSSDGSGKGTITFRTGGKSGYYNLQLEATDGRGTKITEDDFVYVSDDASYANWYREGSGEVQIIPDKSSYNPGETMSALIVMPAAKMDALITSEGATLYNYSVERMNSTSAIVHIPIKESYAPMFYLGASAIVNNEMYSETQRIVVVPKGKALRLEVKANKETFRPGEKGTVTVRAFDEDNHPVSNVDVAVGMVDESIYSLAPENSWNIQRYFYGSRYNSVNTTSGQSFDFYGRSYGVAGMRDDDMFSYRDAASRRSYLTFHNADAGRKNVAYGDIKGDMFVQPVVRKNFKDMMFWTPSVRTNADGSATLNVEFPDNLTTWRITARGVTANTAVGQTVERVIARKDLLVRMETPRFMNQGDELLIATNVHNYLKSEKKVKVEFSGQNVNVDESERTITVAPNSDQRVDWKVTANNTGKATFTVKALTNEESDAMELTVPVLPRGLKSGTGAVAELSESDRSQTMTLSIPRESDATTGEMYVNVSPSLSSSVLTALDDLIGYPYGCVEQTMSRFLPTVVVADALKKLNLPFDEKKRAEIPKMVGKGLTKLYNMQHSDGGWGWWENDESDPFMTAYVMYGLTVARRAGYDVIDDRYDRGLDALRGFIQSGKARGTVGGETKVPLDATTRAYQLYVLSFILDGKPDKLVTDGVAALMKPDTVNTYARSLMALASKFQRDNQQAMQLASKIEADATQDGGTVHWSGKTWHYDWQDDEVETSAFALRALLDIRGETDLVKKGIHWILMQKNGNSWDNTRQTAMVIYSLVDYLKTSSELNPDYTYTVEVNGKEVLSGRMTKSDVFKPEQRVKIDRPSLVTGNNTVVIRKSGTGRLYSTARITYYATGSAIQPASSGFKVSREYYVLRKEKKDNKYYYVKEPFNGTVRTGDELFVRVKMSPDALYEFMMLEDPLPAGCKVIEDTRGYIIPDEKGYGERDYYYSWYWWYADREVRDNRMSFFARRLYKDNYEFTYIMRAQIPGTYSVMPTLASLMYYPEVRGNGAMATIKIKE